MAFRTDAKRNSDNDDLSAAVNAHMAVIWFTPEGEILEANENFCRVMGYDRQEIVGKRHAIFVEKDFAEGEDYREFWTRLKAGESFTDVYPRVSKTGRTVWIRASYVPILDAAGQTRKVVKFARDVTQQAEDAADSKSRLEAINRSQAVIEFRTDGTIVTANRNFLDTVGYSLEEVRGKHHSIFVGEKTAGTPEYADFWQALARGEYQSGAYRRYSKSGTTIWLRATYNPISDSKGNVVGVVKFANDVTEAKQQSLDDGARLEALNRSQATIAFEPDGTILRANRNFLDAMGYELDEIIGKHHSIFIDPEEAASPEYAAFWDKLRDGEYQAAEYRRIGKGGREVWIQASYNPIVDADGYVTRVEKFATDITGAKHAILAFRQAMSRLAASDLSIRISKDVPPEFEGLKSEFNHSLTLLCGVIAGIAERTGRILSDASQIEAGADDLSMRTERQAATLEETAAALDQMAESVRTAAQSAESAANTANSAEESTRSGLDTVRKAVAAMNEIEESSKKVSNITDVIDSLAFQTNLLALNAGVEAARAGETGRGFAVVASEVRQLAQRSSEASQEIADLIRTTSGLIQNGVGLVDASGSALEQIAQYVEDIRGKVAGLASAAQEQSQGLDDINSAASQLDQVTQQNAAMFQETTAATQSLKREVENLSASTEQFTLGGDDAEDDDWDEAARRSA
ncbi:PAS domain-containing methyl-accepting chemotaxis protein [Pseudoruegeria sp. HB172150]|uniref:methyl-accepting chemotaxis protein n=1 Tax=Pseudoruegeria sp. HB172150 TaxID=2721164 RepID=UPI0015516A88|nr:PAS domain-containing methyl-accepting chemotaxis protein [Pseudoruegeria sp. HB172150]